MATTTQLSLPLMSDSEILPFATYNAAMQILDGALGSLASSGVGINSGLVSRLRSDEPSGVRYDSVGPNHLKENGGTIAQTPGKIGFASLLASASSQWLSVPDNTSLAFTTAFSVSLWLKYTTIASDGAIIGQWDYQTQGSWMLASIGTTSEVRLLIADSLTDAAVNHGSTTTAGLVTGTWYHLVGVYDGSLTGNANRLKLYKNGAQLTLSFTGTIPATMQNSTADLKIGKFGGTLTRYLNGAVDAVRLYNRALTAAEVTTLYNAGNGVE